MYITKQVDINNDESLICNESLWNYIKTCEIFSNKSKFMNIFYKKHYKWVCKKLYKVYGCMGPLSY